MEDHRSLTLAESGRLHFTFTDVRLDRVIEDTRIIMDAPLRKAGFLPEWRPVTISMRADDMRLRQALLALVENARMHATPGRVRILCETAAGMAVLAVEDTGPGVQPDLADQLFEPFRVEPSRKGSGLGLTVVRSIAEALGGTAGVSASSLGGSRFEMRLPLEPVTHTQT